MKYDELNARLTEVLTPFILKPVSPATIKDIVKAVRESHCLDGFVAKDAILASVLEPYGFPREAIPRLEE